MARKKKEPEIEWKTGQPDRPGLYDCMVNGERKTLQLHRCIFSKKIYWMNIDGTDVDPNAEVLWRDGNPFRN